MEMTFPVSALRLTSIADIGFGEAFVWYSLMNGTGLWCIKSVGHQPDASCGILPLQGEGAFRIQFVPAGREADCRCLKASAETCIRFSATEPAPGNTDSPGVLHVGLSESRIQAKYLDRMGFDETVHVSIVDGTLSRQIPMPARTVTLWALVLRAQPQTERQVVAVRAIGG